MGLFFESLAIRDLRVYADGTDAKVFHYRDSSGLETDAIVERRDGTWIGFEVKLGGETAIEEAAATFKKTALTRIGGTALAARRVRGRDGRAS